MQKKEHKFYRSKWVGYFALAVVVLFFTFSAFLIADKSQRLMGIFLAATTLTSLPLLKNELKFKQEIVVVTEDALFIKTKKIDKKFDLAEVSHVEFKCRPGWADDNMYLFIHYYVLKEPERIFLPDLNVSKDDLEWLINTRAQNYYKLYNGQGANKQIKY